MPIVGFMMVTIMAAGAGLVGGGAVGAVTASVLQARWARERENQGVEVRADEEFSAGCGAVFVGAVLGSVLGGSAAIGLEYLVVVALAE